MLTGWRIPRRVLLLSTVVAAALVLPLIGAFLADGKTAALALGMGYVGTIRGATSLRPSHAALLAIPVCMAGAVAVALRGQPLAAALFVALCCLLIAPANQVSAGLLVSMPTVVSVLVAVPGTFDVTKSLLWLLAGSAVVVALGSRTPQGAKPSPIPARRAWRHAGVLAASTGIIVFLVLALDLSHGYWVALTLTVVLRPLDGETRRMATQRVAGTLSGIVLSLLLAAWLPTWAIALALFACLVFLTAYSVLGDYTKKVMFLTPSVVLVGSTGAVAATAMERIAATLVGVLLAALIAFGLAWWESRTKTTT